MIKLDHHDKEETWINNELRAQMQVAILLILYKQVVAT